MFGEILRESVETMAIEVIELSGMRIAASNGLMFPAMENMTVVTL